MKGRFIRALKLVAVLFLILGIVHGIVTMIEGRRFAGEIAKVKAAGDYVSYAELGGPPVPDADNAALLYRRVFKQMYTPQGRKHLAALQLVLDTDKVSSGYGTKFYLTSDEKKIAQTGQQWAYAARAADYFASNLSLLRQAQAMPHCQFPVRWKAGAGALFPHYADLRALDRVLCAQAVFLARQGKMDEAVDRLRLSFSLDRNTCNEPILIGLLVKCAMYDLTANAVVAVAKYGNLTEDQAAALSSELSLADLDSNTVNAMKGERAFGLWAYDNVRRAGMGQLIDLSGGSKPSGTSAILWKAGSYVWRPLLYADGVIYLRCMQGLVRDAKVPYRIYSKKHSEDEIGKIPAYAIIAKIIAPVFVRIHARVDSVRARAALAQVLLAAQQYKKQMRVYPESLKQLGAGIPEDPFSGKELVYKLTGNGFKVYSIGENLRDDGGNAAKDGSPSIDDQVLNWPL